MFLSHFLTTMNVKISFKICDQHLCKCENLVRRILTDSSHPPRNAFPECCPHYLLSFPHTPESTSLGSLLSRIDTYLDKWGQCLRQFREQSNENAFPTDSLLECGQCKRYFIVFDPNADIYTNKSQSNTIHIYHDLWALASCYAGFSANAYITIAKFKSIPSSILKSQLNRAHFGRAGEREFRNQAFNSPSDKDLVA